MDSYEIVMTPDAIDDLTELRNYNIIFARRDQLNALSEKSEG